MTKYATWCHCTEKNKDTEVCHVTEAQLFQFCQMFAHLYYTMVTLTPNPNSQAQFYMMAGCVKRHLIGWMNVWKYCHCITHITIYTSIRVHSYLLLLVFSMQIKIIVSAIFAPNINVISSIFTQLEDQPIYHLNELTIEGFTITPHLSVQRISCLEHMDHLAVQRHPVRLVCTGVCRPSPCISLTLTSP